ncbi:MAG: hypothetical protein Q8Q54_07025 [Methylococcales bacterium]|nr:hypothetical protein [Methylococcales bacterium]MDP3838656.1 hypothetical protein [Methylococcales bacterium]
MNFLLKNAILLSAIFVITTAIADDDDDKQPSQEAQPVAGQSGINLDAKAQQHSGLETIKLQPATYHAEFTAYGKVLAMQPLIELRHRYLVALTERNAAHAKFNQAEQSVHRQQALYQEGISAKRHLQEQQAQWQIDKAQLEATHFQDQTLKEQAQLTWGNTLAEWALSSNSKQFNALLSGQQKLLQITLPSNQQLADELKTIVIAASGNRSKAQTAQLISSAPQTDASSQGNSYFFQTAAKNISIGMAVTAWLPEQDKQLSGVMMPKSALLWSMDQAFVYIKTGDTFSRRTITHYAISNDGYFVSEDLKPDEELVVTGAQMLLSEEMRGQIPDED